jgi:ribosome-binding factor A
MRDEIADVLRQGIKDPRVGAFVTVTGVELSADQRMAKVYCSVLGTEEEQGRALDGLRSATGFIRSAVAQRIRLRHAPELVFILDKSIERGVRVVDMINKLTEARGEEPGIGGEAGAAGGAGASGAAAPRVEKKEGGAPPEEPA